MQIRSKIANEAQTEMDKSQRDYILRQQLKRSKKSLAKATVKAKKQRRNSSANVWKRPTCRTM